MLDPAPRAESRAASHLADNPVCAAVAASASKLDFSRFSVPYSGTLNLEFGGGSRWFGRGVSAQS
jgi:hypothetical protein